jgi:hypothetical protein
MGVDTASDVLRRNPITGIAACCARAASGHTAAPPSSVMNVRRFMWLHVAGCATQTGSAGHAGETTNLKLTFHLDHSAGLITALRLCALIEPRKPSARPWLR